MNVTRSTILAILIMAALAACATTGARERLAQAETAYANVVETTTQLRRAGVIGDERARELTPAFVKANEFLQRAHEAIVDGDLGLAKEQMTAAETLILAVGREIRQDE